MSNTSFKVLEWAEQLSDPSASSEQLGVAGWQRNSGGDGPLGTRIDSHLDVLSGLRLTPSPWCPDDMLNWEQDECR